MNLEKKLESKIANAKKLGLKEVRLKIAEAEAILKWKSELPEKEQPNVDIKKTPKQITLDGNTF